MIPYYTLRSQRNFVGKSPKDFIAKTLAMVSQNLDKDKRNNNHKPNFNNLDCLPKGVTLLDKSVHKIVAQNLTVYNNIHSHSPYFKNNQIFKSIIQS